MKSIFSNVVLAGLCLAICAQGAAPAADKLPSVPSNLDFEEGAKYWRVPKPKWRVEDGAGRGGSKGVVCENYDPRSYSFPGQRIALEGGAVYRFGCWVKGKVMKDGKAILPSVSLDWSDANGKWLSAAYAYPVASNEPNTDGWVRYEGLTSPLPDEAASGTLLCFLPRGATGKVQFDDYFFKPEDAHPVDWLMSSAYRNTAADGTVTFHASLYINRVKHPLDSLDPQFIYKANDGRTVTVAPDKMSPRAASVAIPVERMAEGPQTVAFALRNRADGKELGRAACTFTRGTVARRVAFDKHKRTLVDGKPFLPLGMYASVLSDEAISKFTNGVFNCIMPYNPKREQLDAAHAAGLKVIYSVKDMVWGSKFVRKGMETREKSLATIREVVEAVKGHPALLAWYVNDEAPERQIGPLREINEMIHELDPDHPTWAVTDKPWHVRPFIGSYDCIGMDPYPIGNNRGGIDIAGGWALEARAGSFDVVPMWHVPQCFNWKWYRGSVTNPEFRFPTREELDSMFWQAIAAGANGLVPYAFHAMQKNLKGADYDKAMGDVKAVMASVKRREAIILSDPGPSATADSTNLLCRTWTTADGETWLLLSNANRAKVTATVKLGASFREAVPEAGVSATLTSPGVLSVELAPLASGFVRLVESPARGDGMIPFLAITGKPTEAEVRAKVAAIQAQGIDSFLIYARSGLELEYMGEEWLKLNEWFCDEAEKRGMKVWLYDEYNWPSGTCKGRVPNENDAWRYTEYGVYRNLDGTYRWTTALAPGGWVNVCEPAAVARFIELTHEVYAKRLGRWFKNKTILGIFTDEPGHPTRVTFPDGKPLVSFRKYSGLEEEYKAATGRELKADVEKWLATKEGDVWSVYLDLMGKRFRAAYFDQIRAWCDAHGILFTGHMISENDLYGSARCNGNPILCLRGESLPGMDEIHTRCEPDRIEWVTYNVARQAILHRGNGGLAELYACGPANHVPVTLRFVMWMCAFHGIDHYISCMDVMDEKGLVEKHGYLSCMGPIHPWYEKHARVLADEARVAAEWARKAVAEREVAVRYPNRTAQQLAIAGRKGVTGPDLHGLLRTLELNQFTCRLVDENESTDLPLVFTCRADGRYAEERTGKKDLTAADALALCRDRLPATFRILGQDGFSATDVLVRTYTDGSSAVLNLQPFTDRTLVAERNGTRTTFTLLARGVALFGAVAQERDPPAAVRSLVNVEWDLTLDAPNIRRVNFDPSRKGSLNVAAPLKGVRLLTRDCAMSYAVTSSGRPIGINEQPAKGDKVIRHIAEPYAFEMDGAKVESPEPCTSLRPCYDPLYRQTKPFDLTAGEHAFAITSGEADSNFFFPALFVLGDFAVFNGVLMPRSKGKVRLGPLAASGLADFTGTATWSAEVTVPNAARTRLRLATGGRLTQVKLDGKDLGVRAWSPFEWDVPADFAGKKAKLEISISTSVQPMFGDPANGTWDMRFWNAVSGPDGPCGLLDAAWLEF